MLIPTVLDHIRRNWKKWETRLFPYGHGLQRSRLLGIGCFLHHFDSNPALQVDCFFVPLTAEYKIRFTCSSSVLTYFMRHVEGIKTSGSFFAFCVQTASQTSLYMPWHNVVGLRPYWKKTTMNITSKRTMKNIPSFFYCTCHATRHVCQKGR